MISRAREILKAERLNNHTEALQGDLHDSNLWVHGTPGSGKTGYFVDYFSDKGGVYSKDKSKYWNMY